ncbi:hypothetical protein B296_00057587 [Ensete ventricosum]|uniref:Uncharacterized protein n=1 Tax=Ensete ventricosum TaxID=4639 RepID=A0A426XHQ0_ENSVE|nr:hypothetical protein B296_00057587 [Ensete ventricosum]
MLLIAPPVSPLSDEGSFLPSFSFCSSVTPVPSCLNSTFHDSDNDIIVWYNPGARPKHPALGLGRAPRGTSLKRAAWRSSEALGPRLASLERLGEGIRAYLNHWAEAAAANKGEETAVGEAGGKGEGELDHHVIGMVGEGAKEDEVRGSGDENAQEEEEGPKDHCVSTVE